MQVVQILGCLIYGDGVTNTALFINHALEALGIPHYIMTPHQDERIVWSEDIVVRKTVSAEEFKDDDIVLYHYSGGQGLNKVMESLPCKKILVFHNVSYPCFFRDINWATYQNCLVGHDEVRYTANRYLRAIALSEFSRQTLVEAGWKTEDVDVIPLHELAPLDASYDACLLNKLKGNDYVNILFTGRISPNKKIEDIIRIFAWYRNNFNKNSRLILIGSIQFYSYKKALDNYIAKEHIENVIFTGHISDAERNAYYEVADVFLCMSEHEGFCIPLLEAFQRKIPVIAYKATAVPDTMGKAGILVDTKDPEIVCREIARVVSDQNYREFIVDNQIKRLETMTLSAHAEEFFACLKKVDEVRNWKYTGLSYSWLKIPSHGEFDLEGINIASLTELQGIVVYGIGKIGSSLLNVFPSEIMDKVLAICDNGYQGKIYMSRGRNFPVYNHAECMDSFRYASYLITVQTGFLKIARKLLDDGVLPERILFFDNARHRIEAM